MENNNSKKFTIVYKTYKNDLEWFKYSLLSLQKNLDKTDIFEILIYTHDVVFGDVNNILMDTKMINFINYRVIPVHYNYHGYIKQMVVKCNCFKDCQTDYIAILDSDLILQKYLKLSNLLNDNGKINWYYLNKKDAGPNDHEFSVWNKACEDSNKYIFDKSYLHNGVPFLFTKKSLEDANNKFIAVHNCNYDTYCYNRCHSLCINVESAVRDIFATLATVFTEFEYLGYYCHHFSNDYIFISKIDATKNGTYIDNSIFFKQYWSYGGLNSNIYEEIANVIY